MIIKLYVPTYNETYLYELAKKICVLSGGLTVYPKNIGYWVNGKNELEKGDITVFEILTENKTTIKNIMELAKDIKKDLNQQSFFIVLNDKAYFV